MYIYIMYHISYVARAPRPSAGLAGRPPPPRPVIIHCLFDCPITLIIIIIIIINDIIVISSSTSSSSGSSSGSSNSNNSSSSSSSSSRISAMNNNNNIIIRCFICYLSLYVSFNSPW